MKAQIVKSEAISHTNPGNSDFTTQVFQHPELAAICPDRGPSVRDKLIALIAGNVMRDHMAEEQKRQASERVFTLAAFTRFFSPRQDVTSYTDPAAAPSEKPKSLLERMGALAVVLPLLAVLALGAAAWKTSETTSWKNASDGNKELVSVLKEQVRVANEEKKDLQDKNDALQGDIRGLLTTAATDSKTDAKSLSDSINKLLSKPHAAKPEATHTLADVTAPSTK
jgi:hypothetical protein